MSAIPSALQAVVDATLSALAGKGIHGDVTPSWSPDGQHLYLSFSPSMAMPINARLRGRADGNNAIRYALIDAGYHADDPSGVVRVWLPAAPDPAATLDEAMEARCREGLAHLAESPMPIVSGKMPRSQAEPLPSTDEEQATELRRLFREFPLSPDVVACDRILAICAVASERMRARIAGGFELRGMHDWARKARKTERKAA